MRNYNFSNLLLFCIHFIVIVWVQWITQAMMSPYRAVVTAWLFIVFFCMVRNSGKKWFFTLYVILFNYFFLYLFNYYVNIGKLPPMNWDDLYFITGPFYTGLSFIFGNGWLMVIGTCIITALVTAAYLRKYHDENVRYIKPIIAVYLVLVAGIIVVRINYGLIEEDPTLKEAKVRQMILDGYYNDQQLIDIIINDENENCRIAMQQLCRRNLLSGWNLARELLDADDITYYKIGAINVGLDLYNTRYPDDDSHKEETIEKLLKLYYQRHDHQEKLWIMDSLGLMHSWDLFKRICDEKDIPEEEKAVFFKNSYSLIRDIIVGGQVREEDTSYYRMYLKWSFDKEAAALLAQKGIDIESRETD